MSNHNRRYTLTHKCERCNKTEEINYSRVESNEIGFDIIFCKICKSEICKKCINGVVYSFHQETVCKNCNSSKESNYD